MMRYGWKGMAVLFFAALVLDVAAADPDYTHYAYDTTGQSIDFGVQPLAFPIALIAETMRRDLTLRAALAKRGGELRQHPFAKGTDMFDPLAEGKLDAVILGDTPTLLATAKHDLLIVALAKQSYSAVVARKYMRPSELKGQKIGYAHATTAHYTLLEGLASVGLGEKDVTLVKLNVSEMPGALAAGTIDAFAAWEPTPTVALNKVPGSAIIYKGINSTYLLLDRAFVEKSPERARHFIAAYVRAIYWMQQNRQNLERAAQWALEANQHFAGRPPGLTVAQAANIARNELLEVAAIPMIPKREETPQGTLYKQFEFLKKMGTIDTGIGWPRIADSIARNLLRDVLANPAPYGGLQTFNYER